MKGSKLAAGLALGGLLSVPTLVRPVAEPPESDLARYVWDLSSLYASHAAWDSERVRVERGIVRIARRPGDPRAEPFAACGRARRRR